MDMSRLGLMLSCSMFMLLMMIPTEVSAKRWIVGAIDGWTPNVNYTLWAQDIKFYKNDWIFFVNDRNEQNVLQVSKTDYESCNENNPIHSWTNGAGRDIVPLNVTQHYYFISGYGFCYGGMKLVVHVLEPPPQPQRATSVESDSAPSDDSGRQAVWTLVSQLFANLSNWFLEG